MKSLAAAISMLSILPVGKFCPTEAELKRSLNYFPLAGLLFGTIFYGIAVVVAGRCPPLVAAALLTLLPEVWTKGFHLDGLADTADGFLSGRSTERKLEIMRDSRIGAMGVAAMFALLMLKFALFSSLAPSLLPLAAGMMMLCGRCNMVYYIAMSKYARPDGLGKLWFGFAPYAGLVLAWVLPAAVLWLFAPDLWRQCLPASLIALAWLWSQVTKYVIGGATGDTIGCCEELSELWVLVFFVSAA